MRNNIYTIGNMTELPPENKISTFNNTENNIVFVGKMNYEPNIIATTYFANEIFPHILNYNNNVRFIIVGAYPNKKVKQLEKQPNIEVTGLVDSIEPYYQNATIIVAPMQTGAGIQNKIIQAMAYGCCVTTTQIGAEGLTIKNNEIAIFNNKQEWINGIINLLKDKNLRIEMGKKARKYAIDNLSKEIIAKQFWKFIDMK